MDVSFPFIKCEENEGVFLDVNISTVVSEALVDNVDIGICAGMLVCRDMSLQIKYEAKMILILHKLVLAQQLAFSQARGSHRPQDCCIFYCLSHLPISIPI